MTISVFRSFLMLTLALVLVRPASAEEPKRRPPNHEAAVGAAEPAQENKNAHPVLPEDDRKWEITSSDANREYRDIKNPDVRWTFLKKLADEFQDRYGVKVSLNHLDTDLHLSNGTNAELAFGQLANIEDALRELKFDKKPSLRKLALEIVAFDNVAKFSSTVAKGRTLHLDTFDSLYVFPNLDVAHNSQYSWTFDGRGRLLRTNNFGGPDLVIFGAADVLSLPFRGANALGKQMFASKNEAKYTTSVVNGYKQVGAYDIKEALYPIIATNIEE